MIHVSYADSMLSSGTREGIDEASQVVQKQQFWNT